MGDLLLFVYIAIYDQLLHIYLCISLSLEDRNRSPGDGVSLQEGQGGCSLPVNEVLSCISV
ncbi:hypothetical protein D3C71_128770 [compost metagenome]